METSTSLASGSGGKLLGTERLSALPSFVSARTGASGETFAREVERAAERARGEGLQARRLDELEDRHREARRAGFGRERPAEDGADGEKQATEAAFRSENGPVELRPAVAARFADDSAPPRQGGVAPPACSACPEATPEAAMESPPGAGVSPIPSAIPSQATEVAPRSVRELPAAPGVRTSEAQPVEVPQHARPGGKAAKPVSAPPPSAGPDPAVLERAAEILRQIQLHAAPGVRRLTLDLEPAELGRLSVQLALRAGRVAAIVRGERPETLELLQQREDDLLHVLAQRGIAADAVRFELGFRGSRSTRLQSPSATPVPVPSAPTRDCSSPAPSSSASGDRSARIDLYA